MLVTLIAYMRAPLLLNSSTAAFLNSEHHQPNFVVRNSTLSRFRFGNLGMQAHQCVHCAGPSIIGCHQIPGLIRWICRMPIGSPSVRPGLVSCTTCIACIVARQDIVTARPTRCPRRADCAFHAHFMRILCALYAHWNAHKMRKIAH